MPLDLEIAYDIMVDKFNPNGFFLEDTLFKTIDEYKKKFPLTENLERWQLDYNCQLMKYEPNQYYHYIHCENDGSNDRAMASTISVPADSSLNVIDKNTGFYLEENEIIKGTASANSDLECLISYEIINDA